MSHHPGMVMPGEGAPAPLSGWEILLIFAGFVLLAYLSWRLFKWWIRK